MTVTLSLFAGVGAQFLDNNGLILSGGKIYTYNAGTTTPLATYTNNLGNVAQTNPIILNSSGRISTGELWLLNGFGYKFVVEDANNVLIGTYDNVPSSAQPPIVNDASSVAYEPGNIVNAGSFVIGTTYLITSLGNTNFQLIGATSNTVGLHFIATGVGSGTGTAEYSTTVQTALRNNLSISVKDYGAIGDGITDDSAAIVAASATGKYINFPQGNYLINTNISPASMLWYSIDNAIITIPDAITVTGVTALVNLNGLSFYGNMTSAQYTPAITGANIVTAFQSPTYLDSTGTPFAGTDFTHTLISGVLTLSLASITGDNNRTIVSDYIAITSSNKYVFHSYINSLLQTGNFAGLTINTYDNSQVLIGTFAPNASNQLICLTGASYIKLAFKLQRTVKCSVTNGTTIIDLSKLAFFKLINEANNATEGSYGYSISLSSCNNAIINNCTFKYMNKVPVAPVNCNNIKFTNNIIAQCITGLGTNACSDSLFENNYVNLQQLSTDGLFYNLKYLRFKAISGIYSPNLVINNNTLIGANWGIEYSPQTDCKSTITSNTIYAEIFGISLGNGIDSVVNNNSIQLATGFNGCGIELPGSHINVTSNENTIDCGPSFNVESRAFSISYANPWTGTVSHNTSNAYSGLYASSNSTSNPDSKLIFVGNTFNFASCGVFYQFLNNINISNSVIKKTGSVYLYYVQNIGISGYSNQQQDIIGNAIDAGDEGGVSTYVNYVNFNSNLINSGSVVYPLLCSFISNANIFLGNNVYYGTAPTVYVTSGGIGAVYNAINNYTNAGVLVP